MREGLVEYVREPPLTGRFSGEPEDFLVTINHTILNLACPEHRVAVLESRRHMKKKKSASA